MFCPECGKEIPDTAMFCGECGAPVREGANETEKETVMQKRNHHHGKAPIIIAIVVIALIVAAGAVYVGMTLLKQNNVENKYNLINSKIESGEVVLSEASRSRLEEANKNIASWNLVTLNSTERQLDNMTDMVDKLATATEALEDLKEKYNEQKNNANQKEVICDTEKKDCEEALEALEEEIDNNQVSSLERKKKDVERALDTYEKAVADAYEEAKDNVNRNNIYSPYYYEEPTKVLDYVMNDSDSYQYTENELYDYFDNLALTDLQKYALSIIAVNEIYARHGMTFERPSIQGYFSSTKWYENKNIPQEKINSHLNNVELKNIDKLVKVRKYYWELCRDYSQVNNEKPKADDFATYEYQDAMEAYTYDVN